MRFLADENIPALVVERLEALGHEVSWICRIAPGCPDAEVLRRWAAEPCILLTLDKDFGEQIIRFGAQGQGAILFRLTVPLPPSRMVEWMVRVIQSPMEWEGNFSTATSDGRVRMRRLRHVPDGQV